MSSEKFHPIHYCSAHHGYVRYEKLDKRFVGRQEDGRRWLSERTCPACQERFFRFQRAQNLMREGL